MNNLCELCAKQAVSLEEKLQQYLTKYVNLGNYKDVEGTCANLIYYELDC